MNGKDVKSDEKKLEFAMNFERRDYRPICTFYWTIYCIHTLQLTLNQLNAYYILLVAKQVVPIVLYTKTSALPSFSYIRQFLYTKRSPSL